MLANVDAAEHVYEGNWLVRFWEDLTTQYEIPCDIVYNTFEINTARRFADDMLWGIGNTRTYTTTMTLLPLRENELKHLVGDCQPVLPKLLYAHHPASRCLQGISYSVELRETATPLRTGCAIWGELSTCASIWRRRKLKSR